MTFPHHFIPPSENVCGYIPLDTFHEETAVERFRRKTADKTIVVLHLDHFCRRRLPNSQSFENLTKTITLLPNLEGFIVCGCNDWVPSIFNFLIRQFDKNPNWFNFKSLTLVFLVPNQHSRHLRSLVSFLLSPASSALQHLDLNLTLRDFEQQCASVLAAAIVGLSLKKLETLSICLDGDERCISVFVQGLDNDLIRIQNLKISADFSSQQTLLESRLINVLRKPSVKAVSLGPCLLRENIMGCQWIPDILSDNQHYLSSLYLSLWAVQGDYANTILSFIAAGLRKNCSLKHLSWSGPDCDELDFDLTLITNALVDWSDCPPCLESLVVHGENSFDPLCKLVRHPKCTLKYLSADDSHLFFMNDADADDDALEVLLLQKRFLSCMLENTSLASMTFCGGFIDRYGDAKKNLPFKNALQLIVARNKILHTLAAFADDKQEHHRVRNVSQLPLSVFPLALERIQKLPESSPNTPLSSVVSTQGRAASVLFGFLRQRVDNTDMMDHIRHHIITNNAAHETTAAADQQRCSGQPQPQHPVESSSSCGPASKRRKF